MKIINIDVGLEMYTRLKNGQVRVDARLDVPKHEVGDLIIYRCLDSDGIPIEGANLAFMITTKVRLDEFVTRIGEQLMRKKSEDSDQVIILTLSDPMRTGGS